MARCIYKQISFLMNYFLTTRCVHVIVGLWYFVPILLQTEGIMKDQPITTWDIYVLQQSHCLGYNNVLVGYLYPQTIISVTLCLTTQCILYIILLVQQSWIDTVRTEWFACVSQKSLTPACVQSYIATISRLSHKLLDVVVNLQDEKVINKQKQCHLHYFLFLFLQGNTALHHVSINGNLPALNQFIKLRNCDPCILNLVGGQNSSTH